VIRYDLARSGSVTLRIYNVNGALVKVLEDRERPAGRYEIGWGGDNQRGETVSSGVYFYHLKAGSTTLTRKMVLLK
jgi:flagellar hook assembly protein FlgD